MQDDDSKAHWNEVLHVVKSANSELDSARHVGLRAAVFQHIDQEFPADQYNQGSNNDSGVFKALERLRWKIATPVPAMAVAVLALVTAGILIKSSITSHSYFDLPESVLVANLETQIDVQGGSRGLVSSRTPLRTSFLNGALQAQKDLSEKNVTDTKSSDLWFREGYQIEVIYLAAKEAANAGNSEVLQDALEHFEEKKKHSIEILKSADISDDYLENRLELNDAADLSSPDSWARVYRLTRALKIHAH